MKLTVVRASRTLLVVLQEEMPALLLQPHTASFDVQELPHTLLAQLQDVGCTLASTLLKRAKQLFAAAVQRLTQLRRLRLCTRFTRINKSDLHSVNKDLKWSSPAGICARDTQVHEH